MKSIPCTCTRSKRGHLVRGERTFRGSFGVAGHLRYKCTNPACGLTTKVRSSSGRG